MGAELLAQQERAAKRYDQNAQALRSSIEHQTRQNAEHAHALQATIKESSDVIRQEMMGVQGAVKETTEAVSGLSSLVSQLAWLQAEQNDTLRQVLEVIREGRANECRQLVEQGERNFEAGFLPEAEERFRLALGYDNTDYPTHQNLGLTLVRLGRLDEALEHFRKALAFPPKRGAEAAFFIARAATHAARVLYAKSDYVGAERYLERAVEADARDAKNWYDLAVVRAYQEKTDAALEALRRAIDGNALFAGAALADEELATIRLEVERLVLEQTAGAVQSALTAPADSLRAKRKRLDEMARTVDASMPLGADPDEVLHTARQRGTLPAIKDAVAVLHREERELVERGIAMLEDARRASDQALEKRLAIHAKESTVKINDSLEYMYAAREAFNKSFFNKTAAKEKYEAAVAEIDRVQEEVGKREWKLRDENQALKRSISGFLLELRRWQDEHWSKDTFGEAGPLS